MPLLKIGRAVIAKPCLSARIFPNQNLERQINSRAGCCQHQGRTRFGTAENQQLGGTHGYADVLRFAAMVDQSEQSNILRLQHGLELLDSFFY